MPNDVEFAGLLQALEHASELSDRLTSVLRTFIDAAKRGETIDATVLEEYEAQLATMAAQRAKLQEGVALWWRLIGRERAQ